MERLGRPAATPCTAHALLAPAPAWGSAPLTPRNQAKNRRTGGPIFERRTGPVSERCRQTDSAICTAVAPEAVRTRRIHATARG